MERVTPVFSPLTVTFAPGTTAPVVSVTVPRMVAVIFWANDGTAVTKIRKKKGAIFLRMDDASAWLAGKFAVIWPDGPRPVKQFVRGGREGRGRLRTILVKQL